MKSLLLLLSLVVCLGFCSGSSVSPEYAQAKSSRLGAEQERTAQAIRDFPIDFSRNEAANGRPFPK
jgi:hypothetical protein